MLTSPLRQDPPQVFASHLIHVFCPPEGKPVIKYGLHCTQYCTLHIQPYSKKKPEMLTPF